MLPVLRRAWCLSDRTHKLGVLTLLLNLILFCCDKHVPKTRSVSGRFVLLTDTEGPAHHGGEDTAVSLSSVPELVRKGGMLALSRLSLCLLYHHQASSTWDSAVHIGGGGLHTLPLALPFILSSLSTSSQTHSRVCTLKDVPLATLERKINFHSFRQPAVRFLTFVCFIQLQLARRKLTLTIQFASLQTGVVTTPYCVVLAKYPRLVSL